jgi:hypothetical protein
MDWLVSDHRPQLHGRILLVCLSSIRLTLLTEMQVFEDYGPTEYLEHRFLSIYSAHGISFPRFIEMNHVPRSLAEGEVYICAGQQFPFCFWE